MRERQERAEAIRRADPAILEATVRECLPGLMRTALASGLPRDRAEDAVQSALLVFLQRAADFDGRAQVSTWIQGMLVRKIWEQRRGVVQDGRTDDIETTVESRFGEDGRWIRPPEGPDEALARGVFRQELAACLDGLADQQRLAFTLREVEGFATQEICNILDVTANNLGVLLYRARNRLRECLESRGIGGNEDAAL